MFTIFLDGASQVGISCSAEYNAVHQAYAITTYVSINHFSTFQTLHFLMFREKLRRNLNF
jgi:hypothetical protein